MIDESNPEKARLTKLVKELVDAMKDVEFMPHEPEPDVAMGSLERFSMKMKEMREFLWEPSNWSDDLSTADLGELFHDELACLCRNLEPKFETGHHPDCDMWDSKADPGEIRESHERNEEYEV